MLLSLSSGNLAAVATLLSMVSLYRMFWHDVQVQYNQGVRDIKRTFGGRIFVNVVKPTWFMDGYDALNNSYADFKDTCMKNAGPCFVEYLLQGDGREISLDW